MDAITYFYDHLGMSADLIEYLIESCVENGHKSIHYIQKVALSWADSGITTKEQAKQQSRSYNKNCYTVLNAFGKIGDLPHLRFRISRNGPIPMDLLWTSSKKPAAEQFLQLISQALNMQTRS